MTSAYRQNCLWPGLSWTLPSPSSSNSRRRFILIGKNSRSIANFLMPIFHWLFSFIPFLYYRHAIISYGYIFCIYFHAIFTPNYILLAFTPTSGFCYEDNWTFYPKHVYIKKSRDFLENYSMNYWFYGNLVKPLSPPRRLLGGGGGG